MIASRAEFPKGVDASRCSDETSPARLTAEFCWVLRYSDSLAKGDERRFLEKIWEYELDREILSRGGKPIGLICRDSGHLDEARAECIRRQIYDVEVVMVDGLEETFVAFSCWDKKNGAWIQPYVPARPNDIDAIFVLTFFKDAAVDRQRKELLKWFDSISRQWSKPPGRRESIRRKLFNLGLYRLMMAQDAQWHAAREVLAAFAPDMARLLKKRSDVDKCCRKIESELKSALKGRCEG